ncbi:ROK family protein [Paenibacillus filicis]|uniref:ROK family protein n=1 Tax=Paenibacillus gyeongsangnamensis TaxID=3388067 RepID=A0ABT4Q4N0_9BACL|nr:ROK family protein [Paenibacillus filicis]MCZ8511830.1 ROK family protein [Paenibacillus filicis]
MNKQLTLGVDLGGTNIRVALVDREGRVQAKAVHKTESAQGGEHVVRRVEAAIEELLNDNKAKLPAIAGIGIGSAGLIDVREKTVLYAGNLGWNNVPLGRLLEEKFQLPLRLANDANAAALAEWLWGKAKGKSNLLLVSIGTGVGGGVISGGRLLEGVGGGASEIGHMSVDIHGPECGCGNRGCLELYASGTAIGRRAEERRVAALAEGRAGIRTAPWPSAVEVRQSALEGDALAQEIIQETAYYLGMGVVNLIHLFNPEEILFTGGVMDSETFLLPEVIAAIKQRCIPALYNQITGIGLASLGGEAGLLGAAGLHFVEA